MMWYEGNDIKINYQYITNLLANKFIPAMGIYVDTMYTAAWSFISSIHS